MPFFPLRLSLGRFVVEDFPGHTLFTSPPMHAFIRRCLSFVAAAPPLAFPSRQDLTAATAALYEGLFRLNAVLDSPVTPPPGYPASGPAELVGAPGPFVCGSAPGIAEWATCPAVVRAALALRAFRGVDLAATCRDLGLPRLHAWVDAVLDRPTHVAEVSGLSPEALLENARRLYVTATDRAGAGRVCPEPGAPDLSWFM